MSKKSIKKVKNNPIFKLRVWINSTLIPGSTEWNDSIVRNLSEMPAQSKPWKGKFIFFKTSFTIKSKTNTFVKSYELKNVKGVQTTSLQSKVVVIGVFDDEMNYITMRCESAADKERIIKEISGANNLNTQTIPELTTAPIDNSGIYLNHELSNANTISFESPYPKEREKPVQNDDGYFIEERTLPTTEISNKSETKQLKTMDLIQPKINNFYNRSSDNSSGIEDRGSSKLAIDSNIDSSSENETMWIEDTKYIDYIPSLGRNAETENGSIFMYCAYQLVPSANGYDSNQTDSD